MRLLPRSLFGRLVLIQIAYGALVALAFLVILELTHSRFHLESSQRQALAWAGEIVDRHRALLLDAAGPPWEASSAVRELLTGLGHSNPSARFYLIGTEGGVIAASLPPERIKRAGVDPAPLRMLLRGAESLPLLIADPAEPSMSRVFSVAPVGAADAPSAYFVMVLLGPRRDGRLIAHASYPLGDSLVMVGSVTTAALGAAVFILFIVLRPIRRISRTVDSMEREHLLSGCAEHATLREPASELDQLSRHFDRMARRIVELVRKLTDDDRKMREMFANISHDLRTPLAVLQGCIETLIRKGESASPEYAQRLLASAAAQTRSLICLVGAIFELAKLQNPGYRLQRERFCISEAIHDVANKFTARAQERGIAIVVSAGDHHVHVFADVLLVERVLDNLLGNAIQHAQGASRIEIALGENEHEAEITVADDGQGLPACVRDYLSEAAASSPQYTGATERGAGLGLGIARRVVDLHGSRLTLVRTDASGTVFRFSLPKAAPS